MPAEPFTVLVVSDSLGDTADVVLKAAVSQFPERQFRIQRLPKVTSGRQLRDGVSARCGGGCVVFFTLASQELRMEMLKLAEEFSLQVVDVLGPAVGALERASGTSPSQEIGVVRRPDSEYFQWLRAVEFAVKHDDGRNTMDLLQADVVLIGVSRTGKTPLSMYLAFKGYRTANVPLAPGMAPPSELFQVEPRRVFGLTMDPDTLANIRGQRVAELGAYARRYADPEEVEAELEEARRLMKQIGCIVVRAGDRAIEETAHEIIRYLER